MEPFKFNSKGFWREQKNKNLDKFQLIAEIAGNMSGRNRHLFTLESQKTLGSYHDDDGFSPEQEDALRSTFVSESHEHSAGNNGIGIRSAAWRAAVKVLWVDLTNKKVVSMDCEFDDEPKISQFTKIGDDDYYYYIDIIKEGCGLSSPSKGTLLLMFMSEEKWDEYCGDTKKIEDIFTLYNGDLVADPNFNCFFNKKPIENLAEKYYSSPDAVIVKLETIKRPNKNSPIMFEIVEVYSNNKADLKLKGVYSFSNKYDKVDKDSVPPWSTQNTYYIRFILHTNLPDRWEGDLDKDHIHGITLYIDTSYNPKNPRGLRLTHKAFIRNMGSDHRNQGTFSKDKNWFGTPMIQIYTDRAQEKPGTNCFGLESDKIKTDLTQDGIHLTKFISKLFMTHLPKARTIPPRKKIIEENEDPTQPIVSEPEVQRTASRNIARVQILESAPDPNITVDNLGVTDCDNKKRDEFSQAVQEAICKQQFGDMSMCPICDHLMLPHSGHKRSMEYGHIKSACNGGRGTEENGIIICFNCNREIGGKDIVDYIQSHYDRSKIDQIKENFNKRGKELK